MTRKYGWVLALSLALMLLIAAGCSKSDNGGEDVPPSANIDEYDGGPVELVLQDRNSGLTDYEFDEIIVKAVKAKYPEITLHRVAGNIEELIVAGNTPDLVAVSNPAVVDYRVIDYPEPLEEMIRKYNFDLERIEPIVIEEIRALGDGQILGLPFGMNHGATIYNKDIFDRFGVSYPGDLITFEDMLDYARNLTRLDDGVQFFGASLPSFSNALKQYGISSVDANEEFAVYNLDGHRHVFGLVRQFFDIPGYVQGNTYQHGGSFFSQGTVAMTPNWLNQISRNLTNNPPNFEWGITTFPVFKDKPERGNPLDFHLLLLSSTSTKKEAAFRVINTILSDEVQLALTKNARLTALDNVSIKSAFAEDAGVFDGKNISHIFSVSNVRQPYYTINNTQVLGGINAIARRLALESTDLNTILREEEEKANQAIRSLNAR